MKKKLLGSILTALVISTSLVGCGETSTTDTITKQSETVGETANEKAEEKLNEIEEKKEETTETEETTKTEETTETEEITDESEEGVEIEFTLDKAQEIVRNQFGGANDGTSGVSIDIYEGSTYDTTIYVSTARVCMPYVEVTTADFGAGSVRTCVNFADKTAFVETDITGVVSIPFSELDTENPVESIKAEDIVGEIGEATIETAPLTGTFATVTVDINGTDTVYYFDVDNETCVLIWSGNTMMFTSPCDTFSF